MSEGEAEFPHFADGRITRTVHIVHSPFKTGTTSMGAFLIDAGVGERDSKYRGPLLRRSRKVIGEANAYAREADRFSILERDLGDRIRALLGEFTRTLSSFDVFSDAPLGHTVMDPFVKRLIAPAAKFIWINRDFDDWLASVEHWEVTHPQIYPNHGDWETDRGKAILRCWRLRTNAYKRFSLLADQFPGECLEVSLEDQAISRKVGEFYGVAAPAFPRKNISASDAAAEAPASH